MNRAPIPGPWIADHSGFGDATVRAKCGWKNKDGSRFEPTIVERIDWPTAKLIASAPELLAALQAIVAILDGRQPIDVPGAVMVANSAIAKAQGGQS